mgnify:FL=1|jgi:hypothetical protein
MLDIVQIHSGYIGRLGVLDEVDLKRIPGSALSQEIRLI